MPLFYLILEDYCTGTTVSTATTVSIGVSSTTTVSIAVVSTAETVSSVAAPPHATNDTNAKATANNFNVFIELIFLYFLFTSAKLHFLFIWLTYFL